MTTTLLRPLLRTAVRSRAPLIARYNSTLPPGTTKDDSHPNLYYHLNPPPPSAPESIILSFLPTPPVATSTYLGTLPAVPEAGLNDFKENPQFRKVLHEAVKDGLGKNVSYAIQYEAESRPTDGYITITDERNLPPQGRIGDTEDLIASVFVGSGKVDVSTYEPLPSYRLVTGNGVCTLPVGLDKHVVQWLAKIDAEAKNTDK